MLIGRRVLAAHAHPAEKPARSHRCHTSHGQANTMAVLLIGRGPLHVLLLDTIGLILVLSANFPGWWNITGFIQFFSFMFAFYFLFRDIILSGRMMSKRGLFKSWLLDVWNMINILLIVLIFSTFVDSDLQNSPGGRIQISLIAGCAWLKALGFIRVFSVDFATFVLALLQISLDIRSFVAVLLLVILGFANMFILIAASNMGSTDDSDGAFGSMGRALLSLFRMMIGDFDMTWFHLAGACHIPMCRAALRDLHHGRQRPHAQHSHRGGVRQLRRVCSACPATLRAVSYGAVGQY